MVHPACGEINQRPNHVAGVPVVQRTAAYNTAATAGGMRACVRTDQSGTCSHGMGLVCGAASVGVESGVGRNVRQLETFPKERPGDGGRRS